MGWRAAGIAFLVAGVLEVLFWGLSVMGTLLGGAMTTGLAVGELPIEAGWLGPLLLLFYGVWFFATLVAGPVHLAAGAAILMGRRPRALVWAATATSILPVVTVYCAPTSVIAGVLGLMALSKGEGA